MDTLCWRCYRRLPPPAAELPAPPRRRPRISGATLLALVLLAGLGGYFWHLRNSPTAALTAYLRAEAAGDVKAMYELMSLRSRFMLPPDFLSETPRPQSAFVVRTVNRRGNTAEIVTSVTPLDAGPHASPVNMKFHMVREDGRWVVDFLRTYQEQLGSDTPLTERELRRMWRTGLRPR